MASLISKMDQSLEGYVERSGEQQSMILTHSDTMSDRIMLGLDLGGTKMLGLVTDERGQVFVRRRKPTAAFGNEAVRDVVLDILRELFQAAAGIDGELAGIAIGAPGYVDTATGIVLDATNLGVRGLPLGEVVSQAFGLPVVVVHDVKAAALGEARFGAGRGGNHLAFLNVGTGIAVGLVLGGRIYEGASGRAGEVGHVVMQRSGPLCNCGLRGCLEALASGPAVARSARDAIGRGRHSTMIELVDGVLDRLTAETVAEAARQGDGLALELIGEAAGYLGLAIAGLVNVLDLQHVVVGGGLAQMGALLLDRIAAAAADYILQDYKDEVSIVPSMLGANAGILGAVAALADDERARSEWR